MGIIFTIDVNILINSKHENIIAFTYYGT